MHREELEKILLERPFDHGARSRYAELLLSENDAAGAYEQFQLLIASEHDPAATHTGAARCLLALGRETEAQEVYAEAKTLPGFIPAAELEPQTGPPSLVVVDGGRENVVDFAGYRTERGEVSFADVAGMQGLKKTLRLQIIEPFLRPGLFNRFKKKAGGGVLLYGPPGCGKTLTARAIATECNAAFLSVGISDILNHWIGESERNLALLFEKARAERPCVMFFDELDALAFSRSKAISEHSRTVVNEFLSQLDGFDKDNEGVLILAATNMPWDVDPAMKRPGRFARQIFVPPPDTDARHAMLEMKLAGIPCDALDLDLLADRTNLYSGADMDGLIDQAKDIALAEIIDSGRERPLRASDFAEAAEMTVPSTVDWLKTARNLVRYAGVGGGAYKDVEKYLKKVKLG